MANVRLKYSSWKNVSFHGTLDTGIDREEWDEMGPQEKEEVFNENLNRLVDIYEVEDENA